jgi:hypothetical protein
MQQQQQIVTIGEMFISRRQFSLYNEMVMRGVSTAYEMSKIFIDDIIRESGNHSSWDSDDELAYEIFDEAAEAADIANFAAMVAAGYHKNGIGRADYTTGLVQEITKSVHH